LDGSRKKEKRKKNAEQIFFLRVHLKTFQRLFFLNAFLLKVNLDWFTNGAFVIN